MILALVLPSAVFAKAPTDIEVEETTIAVLAAFGLIFMTAMFGDTPEGVKIQADDSGADMSVIFDNFNIEEYFNSLEDDETMNSMSEEMPSLTFSKMSGSITINDTGDMNLNVKLKGGSISTLSIKTSGEDLAELKANGKDYTYLDDIIMADE